MRTMARIYAAQRVSALWTRCSAMLQTTRFVRELLQIEEIEEIGGDMKELENRHPLL